MSTVQQKWIEATTPTEPHKWNNRLAWDQLDEGAFEALINQDRNLNELEKIAWQQKLERCCQTIKSSYNANLLPSNEVQAQRPFIDLWWPLHEEKTYWLQQTFSQAYSKIKLPKKVFEKLADTLVSMLCEIGTQVLWEKFNKGRSPGVLLLAHLGNQKDGSGEPVREYYGEFIRFQKQNGLQDLLEEYPVFAKFIGTTIAFWERNSIELLERICKDREIIASKFSIPESFVITDIKQGLSDPHRKAKSVAIISFTDPESAETKNLVYKPKDMQLDSAYQRALNDLNSISSQPLKTLEIHADDGYGYMEHVAHQTCTNEDQLRGFYFNAGQLTAVLHALGCTDCHHENLIAAQDQLVLIDTETLLEAEVNEENEKKAKNDLGSKITLFKKRYGNSVIRSGLLPMWIFVGPNRIAVDISALGVTPPEQKQKKFPGWLTINTDGMMPGMVNRPTERPTSSPYDYGETNKFGHFLDSFCNGFEQGSALLIQRRDSWLCAGGVLSWFEGLQRRIVLRHTRVYFNIRQDLLKPNSLRSHSNQSLQLEQLSRSYLMFESKPVTWPVFAEEVKQMALLDIPFFTHKINDVSLELGDENIIPNLFESSGLVDARKRLENLDTKEVSFQLELIRGTAEASNLTVGMGELTRLDSIVTVPASEADAQVQSPRHPKNKLEPVLKIIEKIESAAIYDKTGQVEWLGIDIGMDSQRFTFGPIGLNLHSGSIGIACLIKRLQEMTGHKEFKANLLKQIIHPLKTSLVESNVLDHTRMWRDQPLGLAGMGGLVLALQQLEEHKLVDILLDDVQQQFIDDDNFLDVLGGSAGLIGGLLSHNNELALSWACKAGDQLVKCQTEEGCWLTLPNTAGLLGFSHGTAGAGAALACLYTKTGEARFMKAAQRAFTYERQNFDIQENNWPDYRLKKIGEPNKKNQFMSSWCHGAPGIGLSRACLWGTALWDEQCVEEISIALEIIAKTQSINDQLCCGNFGLITIAEALAKGPWPLDAALRQTSLEFTKNRKANLIQAKGLKPETWTCFGTTKNSLTFTGFYTGISGIGMAMLEDSASSKATLSLMTSGLWPEIL